MLCRSGRTSSDSFRRPALSKYGVAVVGVGTRFPAIGASGEGDGFRRIVRRTAKAAAGVPTGVREVATEVGEVRTGVGKALTEVGNITTVAPDP